MVIAVWIRSCGSFNERGTPINVRDPALGKDGLPDQDTLSAEIVVERFLGIAGVFGDHWRHRPGVVSAPVKAYGDVATYGALEAVSRIE